MSTIDISQALAGDGLTVPSGRRCKFGKLLDSVPTDQAAELVRRLHGDEWTDTRLVKLIAGTAFGSLAASALSLHRNGVCICDAPNESDAT